MVPPDSRWLFKKVPQQVDPALYGCPGIILDHLGDQAPLDLLKGFSIASEKVLLELNRTELNCVFPLLKGFEDWRDVLGHFFALADLRAELNTFQAQGERALDSREPGICCEVYRKRTTANPVARSYLRELRSLACNGQILLEHRNLQIQNTDIRLEVFFRCDMMPAEQHLG